MNSDKDKGLYGKYHVLRVDGTDCAGEKHEDCELFVLDLTHDPHALVAAYAYADSCEDDGYEALARDLRMLASKVVVKEAREGTDTPKED